MQEPRPLLLIEDDVLDVKRFKRALSECEISIPVITARNPLTAIKILSTADTSTLPFLIVLDLCTPVNEGVCFIQSLNESPLLKLIPVVVLTGSKTPSDIMQCYENGIAGYVLKPDSYSDYVQALHTVVSYWQQSLSPVTYLTANMTSGATE